MVSRLDTTADLLSGISSLAGQRTALDDVTAVAVFRRPVGTSGT
jgi:hypothetical protein